MAYFLSERKFMGRADGRALREHHRALVVRLLRDRGPLSRAELVRATGLAPATITRVAKELLTLGLVCEGEKTRSNGGRRPTLLSLNPRFAWTIGIKVEATRAILAVVDLAGQIQERRELPLPTPPASSAVLPLLAAAVKRMAHGRVLGVGVAISGFIDEDGVEVFSPILGWRGVPVAASLSGQLGLPVWVENDVNALALAEARFGAGQGFRNFVCATVGEGIGAGIFVDGRLYRGSRGGAGEIGHTLVDPQGPHCRCGERGCLEAVASDLALRRDAARLGFASPEDMAAAARAGHSPAREAFLRLGHWLGLGLKNLVNLLNPEALILGGERMADADLFFAELEQTLRAHAFPEAGRDLVIRPAALGPEGFLIGAATLAFERAWASPLEVGG